MADTLKAAELENIEFAFMVYGDKTQMDTYYLGKCLRALHLNPSLETLEKLGEQKKEGQKYITYDELISIYIEVKKDIKEQGCYEDFIECLKLYDKAENGFMLLGELSHSLLTLGEKLSDPEVDELFEDCLDEENDEGEIPYAPFLKRMCEREPPLKPAKKK